MIVWLITLTALASALGAMHHVSSQQRLQRLPVRVRHNRHR